MYLANEFSHLEAAIQYNRDGFKRNIFLTLDEFPEWRKNNKQYGMFTTAYRYDKPEIREANMIGNLYIDFDVTDIDNNFYQIREDAMRVLSTLQAIFGIPKEMIQIYFSGAKGIHIIVPFEVMGIQPTDELHNIFRLIAVDMKNLSKHQTVDTQIYDKVRLFRVPNSYHPKTGLYKIPITFEELRDTSLGELQELAKAPRKPLHQSPKYLTQAGRIYQSYAKQWETEKKAEEARKNRSREKKLNFMPPCIENIIDNGVKEGKRNNTVAVLASYFMQRGVKEQEALERILEWNDVHCDPPLPGREIEKTAQSIYRSESKYGCRTLQELSICSSTCRLYKERGN